MPTLRQLFWHPKARKPILAAVGLLSLLLLLALTFPQAVLCVDSGDVKADALVVLGGGYDERPAQAAKLFKAGVAPRIILTGEGDSESHQQMLVAQGVSAEAIQVEPKARSTKENAQFTIPLLRSAGAKRVIIVTSWYHSRRALRCFRHYAPDIQFYSRPSYYAYPRLDWSRQGISGYIRAEYAKLAGYWVCYGVCPF